MEDNNDSVNVNQSMNEAADALKDVGVLGGLLDFSFKKFITIRIVKVLYILMIALIALEWLIGVVVGFTQGFGIGLLGIIVVSLAAVLAVIFTRVGLELIVVMFRIGENTSIIAGNKEL